MSTLAFLPFQLLLITWLFISSILEKKRALRLSSQRQSFNSISLKEHEGQTTLFESNNADFQQPEKGAEEHVVYACMDELNAFFGNQRKSKAAKSELMFALHTILLKYPSLKSSEYKESLTNVIATQCENICSIHLNADELKGVWVG